MTPSQKLIRKLGLKDPEAEIVDQDSTSENSRRNFFKKSALGGLALGGSFMLSPFEDIMAHSTSKVNRYSAPSDLKITEA